MAQLVDLGTQSFKPSPPGGQCLVSRATATLTRYDNTTATESRKLDFRNAWITLKQELIVDVFIETYSDPVMSVPNFVKQAVETVKVSLINDSPYLRLSMIHHEYRSLTDSVALHVSVVLRKVPDLSPRFLPRRLPRRVKECAAEPHPPPEIDEAMLSHIAIYMTSLGNPHYPAAGVKSVQSKHETSKPFIQYTYLNEMVDCSLRYLVSGYSQQCKGLVNKPATEEGPSLSDVAPAFFKPGHYENVRQRAGLTPVVTRSMARIFRTCQSSGTKEKMSLVKSNLRTQYGNCTDTEDTDAEYLSRSLIKCVVWTALQRGTYNVEWPKNSIGEDPDMILLSDDDLLIDEFDLYDNCDRRMLNSGKSSDIGSDDILSHCDDGIEPDSGYSSLSSPGKPFLGFQDPDSLYGDIHDDTTNGDSAIDDGESDLIGRPDTEGKDIIRSSSPPPAASDLVAYEDVTNHLLSSSEAFDQDDLDVCGDLDDEDMMDDSSCMSIMPSSTYRYIRRT